MAVLSLLKLILANAATALAISSYMGQGGLPYQYKVVCWIVTYGVFTLLDCLGIRHSANGQIAATFLCVFVLMFSSISNFTVFNWSNLTTKKRITGGFVGLLKGLPYALQFFDGFEGSRFSGYNCSFLNVISLYFSHLRYPAADKLHYESRRHHSEGDFSLLCYSHRDIHVRPGVRCGSCEYH